MINYSIDDNEPRLGHRAVGIIAEYNPFHKGHLYHMERAKELSGAEICVVVMSGSFTQRGEPAVADKWSRAQVAVECGADLVVELPAVFACGNAALFAKGAVEILEGLGVDTIAFGSEGGDGAGLEKAAKLIDRLESDSALAALIQSGVKSGLSYPRARFEAAREVFGAEDMALLEAGSSPNNILAVEYIRHMKKARPLVIERRGAGYFDERLGGEYPSAAGIRRGLGRFYELCGAPSARGSAAGGSEPGGLSGGSLESSYAGSHGNSLGSPASCHEPEACRLIKEELRNALPEASFAMLSRVAAAGNQGTDEGLFRLLQQCLLTQDENTLNGFFGAEEGLGGKAKSLIRYCGSMDELAAGLKSKRYTYSRVRRTLLMILLGVRRQDVLDAKVYGRILAFSEAGARVHLGELKRLAKAKACGEETLPLITNINKDLEKHPQIIPTVSRDILAADLYNLACGRNLYKYSDYVKKPLKCERK